MNDKILLVINNDKNECLKFTRSKKEVSILVSKGNANNL